MFPAATTPPALAAPLVPAAPASAAPGESDDEEAICTDRPTKSNAPCSAEVGTFQLETDLFNGAFLRRDGVTTDVYLATNPTLKYGLTASVDLEANIAPYEVVRTHDKTGATSETDGVGDLYLRLKYNYLNTKGDTLQLALIPYVKAPTARSGIGNGEVEGGLLAPIEVKLTDRLSLITVPEGDALADADGRGGRHFNTVQLVNLGYTLPHGVTLYAELWGDWNFDPARTVRQYSADAAVAWAVTKRLQVDAGLNFGLNRDTPGVQAYFGVSRKF